VLAGRYRVDALSILIPMPTWLLARIMTMMAVETREIPASGRRSRNRRVHVKAVQRPLPEASAHHHDRTFLCHPILDNPPDFICAPHKHSPDDCGEFSSIAK
jgi:hypothetical protein